MARPKEFEPQEALKQAMLVFWEKGYQDTSIADLVQATGVSRYGFYSTFGDKHDLFLSAIDHYAGTAIQSALSPLETAESSLREIHQYFDRLLWAVDNQVPTAGCLIGNTALELPELDDALAGRIDFHYGRMHAAFRNALANSIRSGELPAAANPDALADYLVGVANGYLGLIRARQSPQAISHYIHISLERLS